jgi:hypothetical protein
MQGGTKAEVIENGVLMIFRPKRGEITGDCRRLQSEKLRDLYSSSNVMRVIKSIRMRWTGYAARMREGYIYI